MKRFLSVALVLAFVAFISVPVSASEVFVFERWEPVQFFNDSMDFFPYFNSVHYFYEGSVSSGYYNISCMFPDDGEIVSLEPVYVYVNSISSEDEFNKSDCVPTSAFFKFPIFPDPIEIVIWVVEIDGITYAFNDDPDFFSGFVQPDYYSLISISDNSLSSVVDSGMLSSALNQVVALIPVALGVLIGYIALRKAIAFLQDRLSGA